MLQTRTQIWPQVSLWIGVLAALFVGPVHVRAQTSETETAQAKLLKVAPSERVEYKRVGDVSLKLHFFYPPNHQASDQRPALVFYFGGGWVGGSPQQFYKQAWYLSQRGMVVACAEYRIKSKHNTTPQECVKDGKSAIRYLRKHAKKHGVDPQRICAGGGSAGGHVAAATATVTKFDEPTDPLDVSPKPIALVLFNPVLDNSEQGWGYAKVKDYWQDISPMHNLKSSQPFIPCIFFLGDQDKLIPVKTAEKFVAAVKEAGGTCQLEVTQGAGHGYFNRGEPFLKTLQQADDFLVANNILQDDNEREEALVASLKKLNAAEAKQAQEKRKAKRDKKSNRPQTPKKDR